MPLSTRYRELSMLLLVMMTCATMWLQALYYLYPKTALYNHLGTLKYILASVVVVFIIHGYLAMRAPETDQHLLPITYLLLNMGSVTIFCIDVTKAMRASKPPHNPGQTPFVLLACVLLLVMLIALRPRHMQWWESARRPLWLFIASIILLASPFIPGIGRTHFGATLWLNLYVIEVQPGELVKILMCFALAGYIVSASSLRGDNTVIQRFNARWSASQRTSSPIPSLRDLVYLGTAGAIAMAIIVFQKDLGFALILFTLVFMMLYAMNGQLFWPITGLSLVGIAWYFARNLAHVQVRLEAWQNVMLDPDDRTHQALQGIIALSSGGFFGAGIGQGGFYIVPLANSDMIFVAIKEQLGLVGALGMLLLYLLLVTRGLTIALRSTSQFLKAVATGLSLLIGIQTFVIVAGTTNLIPLTGVTLPLVSAGGSSILAMVMAIACLMIISQDLQRPGGIPLPSKGDSSL